MAARVAWIVAWTLVGRIVAPAHAEPGSPEPDDQAALAHRDRGVAAANRIARSGGQVMA